VRASVMVTPWGDPTSTGPLRALVVVVVDPNYSCSELSISPLI